MKKRLFFYRILNSGTHKMLRAFCVLATLLYTFTLPTPTFATNYDCGNDGDFPMTFGGCKRGYYYEDWYDEDDSLGPDEVGECIACPSGYVCRGGFAGPQLISPYEYYGGGSKYDCGVGHFPMYFAGCAEGYYYEDWQDEDHTLHPDEVGECIECPSGYTCAGGFAGPVAGGSANTAKFTLTTTNTTTSFQFKISAAGEFTVDCGDGGTLSSTDNDITNGDTITRSGTTATTYTCSWGSATKHKIGFNGAATGYSTNDNTSAIIFNGDDDDSEKIASISGSLGAIFGTVSNPTVGIGQPRYRQTFAWAENMTGSIPATLFAGISGAPASRMFQETFSGCSGLTGSIPATLFSGITGTPADYMFSSTFRNCSSLTGSIPANLFAGISGAPARSMFIGTFEGCGGLTGSIPATLFSGITGTPADYMFTSTFRDCSSLTGSIPANLFAGISGAPANNMFASTFWGCSGLTGNIPANLFAGISGAPASNMFSGTFKECWGLTGSIPSGLFAGISGAPAESMFSQTFYGCSRLTGNIPANLFAGISGAPAKSMFYHTFYNCSGLTGNIPATLFAGISGAPAQSMFYSTFAGCSRLTGNIPATLFSGITGAPAQNMFWATFHNCSKLSGYIPPTLFAGIPISGAYYMSYIFQNSGLMTTCPVGTYKYTTGFESYFNGKVSCTPCPDGTSSEAGATNVSQCETGATITFNNVTVSDWPAGVMVVPSSYKENNVNPVSLPVPMREGSAFAGWYDNAQFTGNPITEIPSGSTGDKEFWAKWSELAFTLTTTNTTTSFQFKMSAVGKFTVECGDGGTLTGTNVTYNRMITRSGTGEATYTCSWNSAGAHQIKFGGIATGYTSSTTAAISFYTSSDNAKKIASISGSLGAIFGTVSNPTVGQGQPRFYQTFNAASNMTGSIPANLFAGISGAPVGSMFYYTFSGCYGLTGNIPATLFSGISGAPAINMFTGTFYNCSGLTGNIPATLFSGISGAPAAQMFYQTFVNCSGLTGNIPATLFAGISGAPATQMFYQTFYNCSGLTGNIPATLFAGISGAPASNMFNQTFRGCSGLTGSIPATLFSGISGAPAKSMFDGTFSSCSGLTGNIPTNLFGNLSGAPAETMFRETFQSCSKLSGYIPPTLFEGISTSTTATGQMSSVFNGSGLMTSCPVGTYKYTTGFESYFNGKVSCTPCPDGTSSEAGATDVSQCGTGATITFNNVTVSDWPAGVMVPSSYKENNVNPVSLPVPMREGSAFAGWYDNAQLTGNPITEIPSGSTGNKEFWAKWSELAFTLTTTNTTTSFQFEMSAAGNFTVECGDGGTLTGTNVTYNRMITRSGTTRATYTCSWNSAGAHQIKFGGFATGYSTNPNNQAIVFRFGGTNAAKISSISGSLGAIFGTVSNPPSGMEGQPRFTNTFASASNMTGSIPANLFSGISGAPVERMFAATFSDCSGLTGSIPANLFAGITGAPAESIFSSTFNNCSGLTGSIPATLFSGISGAPAKSMFSSTFYACRGLTGSIPATLFAGISGAPAQSMFGTTFYNCSGLTGSIPATLFGNMSGAPAKSMFDGTFSGCSKLSGYIPPTLFAGISTSTTATGQMSSVFNGSGLMTSCPVGTYKYTTGFESYFNGKVSCTPCPDGTSSEAGATDVSQCETGATITFNNVTVSDWPAGVMVPSSYKENNVNPVSLPVPMREGSAFAGWYDNAQLTGNPITEIPSGSTGDKEFWAKWSLACPADHFVPANHPEMCFPHVLHVGNNMVYLSATKNTTPALNVAYGNDVFYANSTTTPTYMSDGSEHYFKTTYNNQIYYIYDDTIAGN